MASLLRLRNIPCSWLLTEMTPSNCWQDRERFVGLLALVVLLLVSVNIVLQALYTNYWVQPIDVGTKLGIASYEMLILSLTCSLMLIPAYVIWRRGYIRSAVFITSLVILGLFVFMLSSWIFQSLFDRFLGVYALQMLSSDANQIWGYVFKLPSLLDIKSLAITLLSLAGVSWLILLVSRRTVQSGRYSIFLLASVSAVALLLSLFFNKPRSVDASENEFAANVIEEVRSAQYSQLKEIAGPFSGFLDSLTKSMLAHSVDFSIDTTRLVARSEPIPNSGADIKKRNVVFIIVESLHPDVLGAYGSAQDIMPTINELSEDAFVFDRAYSQASHSNYAYISAMSGQYPLRSMGIHFYPENPTYPKSLPYDVLKPLGYQVGLFGSHNDNWGNMSNYLMSDSVDRYSHVGSDTRNDQDKLYEGVNIKNHDNGNKEVSFGNFMYQSAVDSVERLDGETMDIALEWLNAVADDDPFFLYLNLQAGHMPFDALPENYERRFLLEDDDYANLVKAGHTVGVPRDYVIKAYWDALYYVDSNIKRLVDELKATGDHENTIYVITSDTSMRLEGRVIGNGGQVYADVLRIPLVMSVPDRQSSGLIPEPVAQVDIMPTVLSAIGVGAHPASQGVDVINNRSADRLIFSIAQTPAAHQYSLIYKGWQLVHDYNTNQYTLDYIESDAPGNTADVELSQWMVGNLNAWKRSQLAYYSSEAVYSKYFPPRYDDASWKNTVTVAEEDM